MKYISLIFYLISAPVLVHAQSTYRSPTEFKVAPGGRIVYYIVAVPGTDAVGEPKMQIQECIEDNKLCKTLLTSRFSSDTKENLTRFENLTLSPDAKTLYFEASAWATSDAIHALNLSTGKVSYVTDGSLACVVLSGEYQGDLVVQQHRYFVHGGSHDGLWLYDPSGKEIGLVAQGADSSQVCPTLGN